MRKGLILFWIMCVALLSEAYSIRGTITSDGVGMRGVSVELLKNNVKVTTATTNNAGDYVFDATSTTDSRGDYDFIRVPDGTYVIVPRSSGTIFSPVELPVTISGADKTKMNFTTGTNYCIRGKVSFEWHGLDMVTIELSGGASMTRTSDSQGNYSFYQMPQGTYTITSSRLGYKLTPTSKTVTLSGKDEIVDFVAEFLGATIRGTITSGGSPVSDAVVDLLQMESKIATSTTNKQGEYAFDRVLNGTYSITPKTECSAFSPETQYVTVSAGDITKIDFTCDVTYCIEGTVFSSGGPLAGVAIALSGDASGVETTDSSGEYRFCGLSNGNYTVTPDGAFNLAPANKAVSISGNDKIGVDFLR